MRKNIVITGSTDGIGLETAKALLSQGHRVFLHGRQGDKLARVHDQLVQQFGGQQVQACAADMAELDQVRACAERFVRDGQTIDVLVNNAGVFKLASAMAHNGVDMRFMVNAVAPWVLTRALRPVLADEARVINLSSAAQAPVNLAALRGEQAIADDFSAYAQSKLALTMWSIEPERVGQRDGQSMVAVNPGSLLASKMVREGFGAAGHDLAIGVRILARLALSAEPIRSAAYFDNDAGDYADPHDDALDRTRRLAVLEAIEWVAQQRVAPA